MVAEANHRHHDDTARYAVDIRVFVSVIVIAMAISFGIGVGLGPTATAPIAAVPAATPLPPVTSVQVAEANDFDPDEDLHEPAGQHLLVDIKGIEGDFLDSEERLAKAMVDTVSAAGLTMLSYHCHKLIPKGVSCVGVLLESHISFHTWPDEGVITLDLFTCGSKPLIPVVSTIKELFGIGLNIEMQWSHELRGFRNKNNLKNDDKSNDNYAALDHNSDLSQMIWSPIDCPLKEQIVSTLTKVQRVDIWDLVGLEETPSHQDAIKHNLQPGDPRWTTSEIVSPTRYFFLDGVLQSSSGSHHEYHESLVHPGMFSHADPKRVAIVGGAEGATLREVLKHKTVEKVVMVEIDDELIEIVKTHLPMMSDCSDLIGRAANCFDDPLTNLVVEDAKGWFMQRYGPGALKPASEEELFDVVIVDAIEPQTGSPISKDLYDTEHLESILKSLTDDGIMIIQIGRAPTILDPRPDIGYNAPREALFKNLEALDEVEAMFVYEDPHCGFNEPRAFMVVCKSSACRRLFYATSDEIDYEIYARILRTHSKARALSYFDGVTHLGYQVAPKAWETLYCRREPTPFECSYRHLDFKKRIFEYDFENEEKNPFEIKADWEGEGESKKITATHVYAKVDIPAGSYIMPEHLASSLTLSQKAIDNLRDNIGYGGVAVIEDFVAFVDEFGHESMAEGTNRTLVEVGASYLIRTVKNKDDANIGRWIPAHPDGRRPKYSPVYERHRLSFDVFAVATKDIPKGTELLKYEYMWDEP
ncbi:spermidine synthase [Nitzschia inconspicua]|uniref:Spermidine synthase n=1 Tax=Nitzschia inconspicua TaxID=303405 RepID=A0A9K3L817_9STRA|nr:spermidine synthase [Nitzschia inconspicua]